MKTSLSLSGGKDSTYLLLELIRKGTPPDECVFFDTGWEFPQMYRHIDRLRDLCKLHGIRFVTLHPDRNFDYLMFEKPVKEAGGGQHFGYSGVGLVASGGERRKRHESSTSTTAERSP